MGKLKLIVLTGAGMSAESGISTFRDAGGLWEQHRVEDVATPEGWLKNPALVLEFYNQRRNQLLQTEPNGAHCMLAQLESDFDVTIITQNIDNLHERAGSSKIVHLHGELSKVRSTGPGAETYNLNTDAEYIKIGDKCPKGFQLRPDIVWFGEAVPEIERAIEIAELADVFLVIGTSLNVYPAAGLLHYVPKHIPVYLIDPKGVSVYHPNVIQVQKKAVEGMKELLPVLLNMS